jgi:hypothetical protein
MMPGLVVRLADPAIGVAQSIWLHIVVQTLVLNIAVAALLFRLVAPWPAVLGVFWLLFGATWNFWPFSLFRAKSSFFVEDWSSGKFKLDVPVMLASWVPQHLIAGTTVLWTAGLMRCIRGSRATRAVLLGVLFAFVAGSSVFVTLGIATGMLLWLAVAKEPADAAWSRRQTFVALAVAAALCLSLLPTYANRDSAFLPNFPAPRGEEPAAASALEYAWYYVQAQVETALRIPTHLVTYGGLAFVLFVAWLWTVRRSVREKSLEGFVAAMGVAFVPIPFFIRSTLYNDLGMRGIIPAELAWGLGATLLLATARPGWRRNAVWCIALIGTAAALPTITRHSLPPRTPFDGEEMPGWVAYVNRNTPLDTPVVIADGRLFLGDLSRYYVERIRLIDPWDVHRLDHIDKQYLPRFDTLRLPDGPHPIRTRRDVCAQAARVGHSSAEVMVLARASSPLQITLGPPRHRDKDYIVLAVHCDGAGGTD